MPPQQRNPPHGPSQPSGPPPSQRAGNRRSPLPPLLCCRRTSAEWSPRLYMPRDAVCSSLQIDTLFGQLTNGLNFGFWCLSKQDSQPGRWEKYRSDFGCETDVSLPVDSYNGMDLFESIQAWNSGQIYVGKQGKNHYSNKTEQHGKAVLYAHKRTKANCSNLPLHIALQLHLSSDDIGRRLVFAT